jgi:hypothetical protein
MMVTQSKAIEALLSKTEKEKQTNFQRITATPEALAEFLSDTCCRLLRDVWSNDGETGEGYWQEDESEWLNWLKQESE